MKPPAYLMEEPDSRLKAAALILWQFAYFHGLNMDACGKSCAGDALRQVEFLYRQSENKTPPGV